MSAIYRSLLLLFLGFIPASFASGQHARWVDPFLGADGGGNVFPGATLPFGMVKAGPDMGDNTANAGWTSDGVINGFSQTHVSGTGGGAKYGNILVQPTTGEIVSEDHASPRANERASAGSYDVTLSRYNIRVQIAATRHAALYRFTFPETKHANILLDAGHCLSSYANQNEQQFLTASTMQVISPTEFAGSSRVNGGWNFQTRPYTVFFYAVVDTPARATGTWKGAEIHAGLQKDASGMKQPGTGAWSSFATRAGQTVQMKLGISFISIDKAKKHLAAEIPAFDMDHVRAEAQAEWDRALAPITIEGATDDQQRQFFTALYHSMLMPTDRTGENPLFQSTEPSYDDFYAIWDTFRSSGPLLTLIAHDRESGIVRSLVDLYRHEGWLPDARSGNFNGRVQGGSNADMMIADGFLKHLPAVNWKTAYAAVRHDAETNSPNPVAEGRGDLDDWKRLGYLTIEGTDRPASKHMEYAANDYAVALMAKGLGIPKDYALYSKRAANWRNLWDTDAEASGFRGFVWPRHRDGTWKASFDPLQTGTWGSDSFYEGNPWTYSTYVPQDVAGLIQTSGGNERFTQRMDAFFTGDGQYDVGNEPGFLAPYLYLWAGHPDHTQRWLRSIVSKSYRSGPTGLPGNDDSGAMSSWYAFAMMGFYPNAAQNVYLIGSPVYLRTILRLPNRRTFILEREGTGLYVASVTWNGKPWSQPWFTHEELMAGGTLHFFMSNSPSPWGKDMPPPSMSTPQ